MKTGTNNTQGQDEDCKPGQYCPRDCEDRPPWPANVNQNTATNLGVAKKADSEVAPHLGMRAREGGVDQASEATWRGLRIRYQATWTLVAGQPGKINYCVKPVIEVIGTSPRTAPMAISLVDERGDEIPNEDPNNPGFPIMPANPLGNGLPFGNLKNLNTSIPHSRATFSPLSVVGPMPMQKGSKSGTQPDGWCVQNLPWISRPELTLRVEGRSCRVNFGPPSASTSPAGDPKAKANQQR